MDADLIRSVLLGYEDEGRFPTPYLPDVPASGEELSQLLEDLEGAGLLVLSELGRGEKGILGLTMRGHDFAATARDLVAWEDAKRLAAQLDRQATPEDFADLLEDYARLRVDLPPKAF